MAATSTSTNPDVYYTCDACLTEVSGYNKRDLQTEGWEWHPIGTGKDRWFVMCGDCLAEYTRRRALRDAAATS